MKTESPEKKRQDRSLHLFCLIGLFAVALLARLLWVQIAEGSQYEEMAMNQTEGIETLFSPRGTIYDRNGKELAFSITVKSFFADPGTMNVSPAEAAKALAPLLRQKESVLEEKMSRDTRFVWMERMMEPEDSDKVQALLKEKKWTGFGFFHESRRYYPNGSLAANVLGFVGIDDKGLDGLEMSLDDLIRGGKESQKILTDARGNLILKSALAPFRGEREKSVYLTIDENIQFYAERALNRAMKETKARNGIIIVMDPKTGAILALGNSPSYDPNHFENATEAQFKNRAVTDIYEPGSTFKPIIASAALAAGTYDTEQVWHDPGVIRASGHEIKNWDDESYGDVRMVDIIKWSINTGFAHIGMLTGGETLTKYAKDFGFGRPTGIELPGEGEGLLFNPEDMRPIDVATMSIGQSIAVTPLQMVQAYSAIANGGKMVKPHIIDRIKNPDGSDYQVTAIETSGTPISAEVADQVKDMMEKEVSEGGGTNARIPGYHMAGKTGTAQKLDNVHGGYLEGQYIASFCGFGPTEDPKAICLIVLDTPSGMYYGGQVAAPVFKEAMTQIMRYLKVPTLQDEAIHAKPEVKPLEKYKPEKMSGNSACPALPAGPCVMWENGSPEPGWDSSRKEPVMHFLRIRASAPWSGKGKM